MGEATRLVSVTVITLCSATVSSGQTTVSLADLHDTLKPQTFYLDAKTAPEIVTIPITKTQVQGRKRTWIFGRDTVEDTRQIPVLPAETTSLPFIRNDRNEPVLDKDGNVLIMGDFGGRSHTQTYTTDNGLALDFIGCGFTDKSGNIWFGTYGGVSRYDGKSFTNYTSKHGLANNVIQSIIEDNSGNLWFGTAAGISCYDGRSFTNFTREEGLANNDILSITEDNNGNLWFGTNGGGVSRFDGVSFTNYTTIEGLASNVVLSITEDEIGQLWFGTSGGGVSCYDGKYFKNYTTAQGLANNVVLSMTKDIHGNLWFGTDGGGVSRYNGESFTNYTTTQGLTNDAIASITEDNSGNLWFGTDGAGVICYSGKSFVNYTNAQGLPNDLVLSIIEDKSGNLWFGTYGGGLSRYNGKSFTNYKDNQGIASNYVRCVFEDKVGNLWIGTSGGGVSRFDGKSFTNYTTSQGLAHNVVFSISQDQSGNLWFGTYGGGVSCYDGKSFTNYTTEQGLANNHIWSIIEDKTGNLWFGTDGGGVTRFDGKSFTNYTTAQGLAHNVIFTIIEDKTGNLWFGTDGGGVSQYDGKTFTNYSTEDGLPNDVVCQIAVYNDKLYVGTNFGFCELVPVSTSHKGFVAGAIYNSQTGFPVKDVNVGQNSMYKDSDGILWIGTGSSKTGLVRFEPNSLHKSVSPPTLVLQKIKIDGKKISFYDFLEEADSTTKAQQQLITYGKLLSIEKYRSINEEFKGVKFDSIAGHYPVAKGLVLPYRNNSLTFEFIGIETGRNFLLRYQTMLEGYSKDWSTITETNSATFNNLSSGTYTFKVRTRLQDRIFGEDEGWSEPFTYTFMVLPPWYKTWWMYSFYLLTAVLVLLGLIHLQTHRIRARANELREQVRKATATISQQKEIVLNQKRELESKHQRITDSIRYAKRIQESTFPSIDLMKKVLKDVFVLFKPKDVVSGDFFWTETVSKSESNTVYFAVADCTGHGVPGAMVSVFCSNALTKALLEEKHTETGKLLDRTREIIIENFSRGEEHLNDGMDISLCAIDFSKMRLQWSGANNPLLILRKGAREFEVLKPDKQPVGMYPRTVPFTSHELKLQLGDTIYLLTDGYPDQFGGDENKKYKIKQLKDKLLAIANKSMDEQLCILNEEFEHWRGECDQVDDVCLIGVRIR